MKSKQRFFYYITHKDNIPSILKHGILSHREIEKLGIDCQKIYNPKVVDIRKNKKVTDNKTLWDYANLYFQPRNAMLYTLKFNLGVKDLAIIAVKKDVAKTKGSMIANGNAASSLTEIELIKKYSPGEIEKIIDNVSKEWWDEESKRLMMAELLAPTKIEAKYFGSIYVANDEVRRDIDQKIKSSVNIIAKPEFFFLPKEIHKICDPLKVIKGDMFFSELQVLTISVNTVGVMGKGLASRTKWQFPDVYVKYQNLCKNRKLQMGKPCLFRREKSFHSGLIDDLATIDWPLTNGTKWFLLFPTKTHWRENSDYEGIKKGLQWLKDNAASLGIESIALPALGCGLGKLKWEDIGPLMCKTLCEMDISSEVYLPTEKNINPSKLTKEFLLSEKKISANNSQLSLL